MIDYFTQGTVLSHFIIDEIIRVLDFYFLYLAEKEWQKHLVYENVVVSADDENLCSVYPNRFLLPCKKYLNDLAFYQPTHGKTLP